MIRAYVAHFEDALQSARSTSRGRLVRARVVVDAQGFDLVNLRYLQVGLWGDRIWGIWGGAGLLMNQLPLRNGLKDFFRLGEIEISSRAHSLHDGGIGVRDWDLTKASTWGTWVSRDIPPNRLMSFA